ncbi:MAG: hypothetical protein B6U72_02605 [Candidatus Altiarchaeales archaeon ex4484_2]|nr:MAG: hypothetical protein B6U72_02605 [Candidatus Altiarchaeales archaeon ex4484_2]
MAKSNRSIQRKNDRERIERRNRILIGIVSLTMIFSGVWFFSGSRAPPESTSDVDVSMLIDSYMVNELGDVVVEVSGARNHLVAVPKRGCLNPYIINEIRNLSSNSVVNVSFEVANPEEYGSSDSVCGLYALINMDSTDNSSNLSDESRVLLRNVLGDYMLYSSFPARSLDNLSFVDEVRVIVNPDAVVGDFFVVSVLQKMDGSGFIGLLKAPVAKGPVVQGEIVDVYGLQFTGLISDGFNKTVVEESLDPDLVKSFNVDAPRIVVHDPLDDSLTSSLNSLSGVRLESSGNETLVYFNDSRRGVLGLLEDIDYSVVEGRFVLSASAGVDINKTGRVLRDAGAWNLSISRLASVSVPEVVDFDGDIVFLRNKGLVDSLVGLDASVGDRINVSLSTLSFGEQTVVVGSEMV